jgi:glycosyltransferase involved in cell wall biosynthesis
VRVFAVKGVEISVRVFAGVREECARLGVPDPVLLVFGSLDEEPGYADVVRRAVAETQTADAVRFLDGVPISSHRDSAGAWRLDEIDLLRVARASHGAVLFTPGYVDVETVGLGPALAALAGIPCAVTPYDAFADHFGSGFARVEVDPEDPRRAGHDLARRLSDLREGDEPLAAAMRANLALVRERFPDDPWTGFLAAMAGGTA